jgi:hypothetical protein
MSDLPLILAGPIVRRVEVRACSFWIALRDAATVTATIWANPQVAAGLGTVASGDSVLASGQAATRRFGVHLHIAIVTIKLDSAAGLPPLAPGTLYSYNLAIAGGFGQADLQSEGLLRDETPGARLVGVSSDAPLHLALGYSENRLPSFVLPGAAIEQIRIAHTSCRKTNGDGYDALAWLDDHLQATLDNLDERSQQLYFTGDQIYADEVGTCLLPMLNGLSRDVLGNVEKLPVKGDLVADCTMDAFPPLRRERLVREQAGFTSTAAANHLLGFGEYAAMYLAAWSPRVWRSLTTDPNTLFQAPPELTKEVLTDWEKCYGSVEKWRAKQAKAVEAEQATVELYRQCVPKVARALANIATYMILDDHEVTDDFNLNRRWRNRVFTKPLGKTIVRNALMAYGIFQGWGNDPSAFEAGNNQAFLDETVKQFGGDGPFTPTNTDKLDELFGSTEVGNDKQVVWHYQIPAPRYLTVVIDSRTHRTFEGQGYLPPSLLGDTQDAQIPGGPMVDGRELLIVVSPAPVLGPNALDRVAQPLGQVIQDIKVSVYEKLADKPHNPCKSGSPVTGVEEYDAEGWAANEKAQEALLAKLATHPRVMLLSGDVHYSASLVLDYWRKDVAQPSRIVQFTSSAARNPAPAVAVALLRSNALLQRYQQGVPAERLIWQSEAPIQLPNGAKIGPGRRARLKRSPAYVPSRGWAAGTTLPDDKPPDSRWRLTLIRDQRPNGELPEFLRQPMMPEFNPGDPIRSYRTIAGEHSRTALNPHFTHLRQMVFVNNIGLVKSLMEGGTLTLSHTLLSAATPDDQAASANTLHKVSLAPSPEAPPKLEVDHG